ncbi:MAG: hypothetical protein H6925_02010 [Holosporaceae bacterium]|nr:MAG: hypothetical protein H6925_02010 [Holosporaceae bacterium]
MKNVKKLIFAGLFTALYLVPTTTFGANHDDQPPAPVTAPMRPTSKHLCHYAYLVQTNNPHHEGVGHALADA